jgi:hypothetical protein
MTLDEARRLLPASNTGEADILGHSVLAEQFEHSSESGRAQLREAMMVLLEEGSARDQRLAEGFFAAVGADADVLQRLAASYVARGWDGRHAVVTVLSRETFHLPADVSVALRRQFVADPVRHFGLAQAVLAHDRHGPSWEAFARAVAQFEELDDLLAAFRCAFVAERESEFFALMRGRPETQVRALAQRMIAGSREKLLAACGLRERRRRVRPRKR